MGNGKCVIGMNNTNSFPLWSLQSVRLRIIIILAIALCIEGLMRTNMNMAMICMVNLTAVMQFKQSFVAQKLEEPLLKYNYTILSNSSVKVFEYNRNYNGDLLWTGQEQAWVFAAFYVGSLLVVFPGSYLCDWIGPTYTVQGGAIINVIGSITTPYISRNVGVIGVIIIRFLMGFGQGILTPCMNVLIAHWFPLSEKSTAVALATTGNQLSIIFAMFITAELCQMSLFGGWPASFYLYSLLGIGLCFGWSLVVKDVPTRVKHITDAELTYITGSAYGRGQKRVIPLNVPWQKILSSTAVWSTALSSFCHSFVVVGTVTYLPLYYRTILSMGLTSNGVLSALPFICQLLSKLAFAGLADKAKEIGFSPNQVTKICNSCASLGGACCFTALIFFDYSHRKKAVFFMCFAMGILSGFVLGYNTSIVCIAPKYTSSVASFCRLWGTVGSITSPYIIGMITIKSVMSEWKTVFIIMICILILTGAIFQLFGTVNEQEWAQDVSGISVLNYVKPLSEKEMDKTPKLELEKGV
ncbi:Major Facilitator Superfamily protein [Brugia malayi]|uniref:Bm7531 n=2 Tax=Brugia malayi TaxID=6279 RepID=A0A0K0JSS9_BRUMA|nr:Major Facilitator Superfamily protein [Brugia malayi]CRZ22370.1 Bm7531 [Brugia malayi]VIO87631.1 Major Facilitator Superfamily protein [Brugia malayi]